MDRLKKFYTDHKDAIIDGAIQATVGTSCIIIGLCAKHWLDDRTLHNSSFDELDGAMTCNMIYKSGRVESKTRRPLGE